MDLLCAVLSEHLDQSTLVSPSEETEKRVRDPRRVCKYRHQFRSNFNAIITLMRTVKLRQEHKVELQKTPFWPLFESIIEGKLDQSACKKSDRDVIKVIKTYDPKSKQFRLGNKSIPLTANDISLIFGILSGKQHMNTTYGSKPDSGFVKRRWARTKKPTAPEIKEQIMIAAKGKNKTDVEDTARLLCMYICATLFFATSGHHLSWSLVNYVEDLDKMKNYAWSNAIINSLIVALDKSYARPEKTTACVLALLYWLCEHTKIMKPDKAKAYPRFLKWNLGKLHEILVEKKLSGLKGNEVLDYELKETIEEQQLQIKQIEVACIEKQDEGEQGGDEEEEEENETEDKGDEEEKKDGEENKEGEEAKEGHINDPENYIVCYDEGVIYNEGNVDSGSLARLVQLTAGNTAMELPQDKVEGILYNKEHLVSAIVEENLDFGSVVSIAQFGEGNYTMELANKRVEELELKIQQLEGKNNTLMNDLHIKENTIKMLVAEKGILQKRIRNIDQYEDKEALLKEEIEMLKESKKNQEAHFEEMKKSNQAEFAGIKETIGKLKEQISMLTEKNTKLEEGIEKLEVQKITRTQMACAESKPERASKGKKPPSSYVQRIKRKQITGKVLLPYSEYQKPMKLSKKDTKDVKESAGAADY